jgi:hypothetical protein
MMKKIFRVLVYTFAVIGFILVAVYAAVELGLTKTPGIIDSQRDYFKNQLKSGASDESPSPEEAWNSGEEWDILSEAIQKDTGAITRTATQADVSPRLIVSILIVEQLRLFHSNRELFKQVFAPLKILAVQSQFSWGVMGIKQDTAKEIEAHLKDTTSPWYLGKKFENILDFTTTDPDTERFERLTNEDDRSYSYLYAALFVKQILTQWERAGFSSKDRPEIVATLYDLGFEKSKPHANPLSGGAEIEIQDSSYSFGSLAKKFYDSEELLNEFPR